MTQNNQGRAIVIGGSMAGLLAARVLADRFAHVTIFERDEFPATIQPRKGVPQSRHSHGLLAGGARVIEQLLPGLSRQLLESGALQGDIVGDSRWYFEGGCLARPNSDLVGLLATRPLLETRIRERVLSLPNVSVQQGLKVTGLTFGPDRQRVCGVQHSGGEIPADLVVDASGRGSQSPAWLASAGYPAPREETVRVDLVYATRLFRRDPASLNGDTAVIIAPTPQGKRGGVMLAQEGDRWTVTLIGHFGQVPPLDLPGFIDYARTLPAPYIHDIIAGAEPVGEPQGMRFPESVRRRYELLARVPEGFLVFGDAMASFNPIYGQGMSVAALEAAALAQAMDGGLAGVGPRFFKAAAKIIDTPWTISVGNDLRMPQTIGPRSAGVNFINWYISKLHRAAHSDPALALAFMCVANLLEPPPSLLRPAIAWRVLRASLGFGGSAPVRNGRQAMAARITN